MNKKIAFLCTLAFLFAFSPAISQEALKPLPSPLGLTTMKFEDTYIKITYGRPHKRGREIFGGLIPYGEVWRTGANEATEITITEPIMINGNKLKEGTYSLFSIPGEDSWTIIINKGLGQWGAYRYNQDLDVVQFDVPVEETAIVYEPFTIEFDSKTEKTNLNLIWDTTKVAIPIEFI